MNSTKAPGLIAILLALICLPTLSVAQDDAKIRRWTSKDGQQTIQARLVNYDQAKQTVELSTGADSTVEVPLYQLSNLDRRYVRNRTRKNNKRTESAKKESVLAAKDRIQLGDSHADDDSLAGAKFEKMYGIRWLPTLDGAKALAKGTPEQSQDDRRPIMWFRVLGELDGFM